MIFVTLKVIESWDSGDDNRANLGSICGHEMSKTEA